MNSFESQVARLQDAAAAASQASAAALKGLKSQLHAAKRQKTIDGTRLHNMQLIVLLNNIRNVVLKSPKLTIGINGVTEVKSVCDILTSAINLMVIFTSHGDRKETGTGR